MLGELYQPSGLALETAKAILEVENPHAVNMAWGCPNGCLYCYGPHASRQSRQNYACFRLPKRPPLELIKNQLKKGLDVEGVFLSFFTDPYLPQLKESTEHVVNYLLDQQEYVDKDIKVATLSKLDVSDYSWNRNGMTVVSPYNDFSRKYEPNVPFPQDRLFKLWEAYDEGHYVWLSMEPWPCQELFESNLFDIIDFFDKLKWLDFIIFGKWNYDKRASTEKARVEYKTIIEIFEKFCKDNKIRYHIKSDTLDFINGGLHRTPTEERR